MQDTVFELCDELGPDKVVHIYDPKVGLKAILVVDNVAAGPSIGGTRMAQDVSLLECFRLARAMTLKNAAAGLAHGGGKSVIFADPKQSQENREALIRAFARAVGQISDYIPGPDMGTDETCMAWVKDEIGRAVGLPREVGGIPLDEIGATGYGVSVAVQVAKEYAGIDLNDARIVIQGFGSVGQHAARFLAEQGAVVIGVSDSRGAVIDEQGLDLDALLQAKAAGHSVTEVDAAKAVDGDALIDLECEVWVPAARPDVIREDNAQRMNTKIVAQGANIPATEAAEKILHDKGILVLPDFIANAGGVICGAVEYHGGSQRQAMETIAEKIRFNTELVLERARSEACPPRQSAVAIATERVVTAMRMRR